MWRVGLKCMQIPRETCRCICGADACSTVKRYIETWLETNKYEYFFIYLYVYIYTCIYVYIYVCMLR